MAATMGASPNVGPTFDRLYGSNCPRYRKTSFRLEPRSNRVMSSLTRASTMAASTGSQWRPQRELETRAKVSETFHVCGRRLSILPATRQAPRDETSCEFKGPDGCTVFLFFIFFLFFFSSLGKNVGTELLRVGRRPNGRRFALSSRTAGSLLSNDVSETLFFYPITPPPFANFFHRFKVILDTCLRLEYRNIEVRIEKSSLSSLN